MLGVWKMDIAFLSANEIASRIRSKEFSCREILEHYLERIDRFNPELNAIVVDLREEGLETADRLDELVQRGEFLGPLHGVPMTCLLYTSPSPRDLSTSRMPSSA